MSGVSTATILAASALAVAAGGTAYSAYAQSEAADEQRNAQNEAKAAAEKQGKLQEEATNKANAKKPDLNAIMSAAQQAAKGGGSSTMLTGSQGIDPSSLQLGKSSLLGS